MKVLLLTGASGSDLVAGGARRRLRGLRREDERRGFARGGRPFRTCGRGGAPPGPARQVFSLEPTRGPDRILTKREREILQLVERGTTNKAIATELTVSLSTIRTHVQSILKKLGAHSKLEAVSVARQQGVLRRV